METPKWIPVSEYDDTEVVAINQYKQVKIGYIEVDEDGELVCTDHYNAPIASPTHFIPAKDFFAFLPYPPSANANP